MDHGRTAPTGDLLMATNPPAAIPTPGGGGKVTGSLAISETVEYATGILSITTATAGSLASFDRISSNGGASRLTIYGATDSTAPAIIALQAPNGTDYADYTFDGNNAELDVSKGNLALRPLASSGQVLVYSPSYTTKLRVGNAGFTQSLDISHDGTNAHISATTGYIGFALGDKFQILPTGAVNYFGPSSTTASAGSNGALPALVGGYLTWQVGGTTVKIPYFLS